MDLFDLYLSEYALRLYIAPTKIPSSSLSFFISFMSET